MPRKRAAKPPSLAMFRRKPRRRKNPDSGGGGGAAPRKNSALVGNPPMLKDMTQLIGPGLAAYGGTRLVGRIAFGLARKRSPGAAKHIGPWSSVAAALALWWAAHRVERVAKYHGPVVIGAFIAAIQGLLQTYLPKYGWLLNDYHLELPAAAPAGGARAQSPAAQGQYFEAEEGAVGSDILPGGADLGDILNEGETEDDLRTGIFAN